MNTEEVKNEETSAIEASVEDQNKENIEPSAQNEIQPESVEGDTEKAASGPEESQADLENEPQDSENGKGGEDNESTNQPSTTTESEAQPDDTKPDDAASAAGQVNTEPVADTQPQATQEEAQGSYPFRAALKQPTTIYRGADVSFFGKSFGGTIEVTGPTDENGFTPVSYLRSGFGRANGYIRLSKEVLDKCRL